MEQPTKRKLAAVLMAAVVGYSRIIGDDDEATMIRPGAGSPDREPIGG